MAIDTTKKTEELVLDDSVKLNNRGEAILGVLEGPCADVINPTRNERQYDEELWNNVFKDPIVNEYFECGGILGELDHPAERTETDTSKVPICMPEKPKKGKDGKLYARFDILDTPNGRIVYTLAKYGYKLGVSSRGNGDVYEAYDGKEHVDPKTYELKAFDIVLLPAVKSARLALKESVGNKTFKQAIKESLESATKDEKRIMVESLRKLKIDYKIEQAKTQSKNKENINLIESKEASEVKSTAEDTGAYLVKELQNQIKENKELKESYQAVQEQLSVCYAKEAKYKEMIESLNQSSSREDEINTLKFEIENLREQLESKEKQLIRTRERCSKLTENAKTKENETRKSLTESISNKDLEIKRLQESLSREKAQSKEVVTNLNEELAETKKNLNLKQNEYSAKIQKAKNIVEHYKQVANKTLSRYIESKAIMLGITKSDIEKRLTENYTIDDIDKICEDLQGYQLALSKLPMILQQNGKSAGKSLKVKVTESKEPIKPKNRLDDEVDDSLLRLAGLVD